MRLTIMNITPNLSIVILSRFSNNVINSSFAKGQILYLDKMI